MHPRLKTIEFFVNNAFRVLGFFVAFSRIGSNCLLQIVDVVNKNAIELIHLRIDVTRNGDINEEHRSISSAAEEAFAMFAPKDRDWRTG